jgi:hypothetical protein
MLALLGAHHILHVSRIRVKNKLFNVYNTNNNAPHIITKMNQINPSGISANNRPNLF